MRGKNAMRSFSNFIIMFFLIMYPSILWAICGGASPNLTSASADRADVADCIDAAYDGDTINIPSDSSSNWISRLEITKQNLTIKGNGTSSTTINGYGFLISTRSNGARITGINFNAGSSSPVIRVSSGTDYGGTPVTDWMIDSNKFTAGATGCISVFNGSKGVIANNEFYVNATTTIYIYGLDDKSWQTSSFHGQAGKNVFIEDNKFIANGSKTNHAVMSSWGGSYVFRCNDVTYNGGSTYRDMVDVHGYGHGTNRRGGRSAEVYGNSFDNRNYHSRTINIRAGSGRIFANRWSSSSTYIGMTDYRMADFGLSMSYPTNYSDCGSNMANYSASKEATNCSDHEGYPCCDQVGMGQDLSGSQRQKADPYYFWDNKTTSGSNISIKPASGTPENYIQSGREYYVGSAPNDYAPYTYPHPDRGISPSGTCLSGGNSSADTGITFWSGPTDTREIPRNLNFGPSQ
jgi:hypothetical protein